MLAQVRRDRIEARGGAVSAEDEAEFKQPILDKYEREGSPYYATARLWDDGILEPGRTRDALGLAFAVSLGANTDPPRWPVFRM